MATERPGDVTATTNSHDWDLIDATRLFWWDMMRSEPENQVVADHLSPYCRIQENFGDNARGLLGRDSCLLKLKDIKSNIVESGLDSKMHHLQIMSNGSETRFILYGQVSVSDTTSKDVTLGVAVVWHGGIVTCLTIVRNVDIHEFMNSDINHDRETLCSVTFSETSTAENSPENVRRPPSVVSRTPYMGYNLRPPYKVSKPLEVPPTVSVVVLGCENLQSRLIRFVSRPVNTRVTIRVGQIAQSTDTVHNTCNPDFSRRSDDPFVFQIPEGHLTNGFIEFTIEDVHLDDIPLAIARIPFAALPLKEDTSIPHDMYIPLELLPRYLFRRPHVVHISRLSKFGIFNGASWSSTRSSAEGHHDTKHRQPVLKVVISKVDIMQWWAMQEMKARDSARCSALTLMEKDTNCTLRELHSMRVEHINVGIIGSPEFPSRHSAEGVLSQGVSNEEGADAGSERAEQSVDDDIKRRSIRWITSEAMW